MSRSAELLRLLSQVGFLLVCLLMVGQAAAGQAKPAGYYGLGEAAAPAQIAGWDIDVRPDGKGLPPGSGSVEDGEMLYEEQCAECHGSFGEAVGRYPALAGGEGSLQEQRPHKTIGSYWGHTSTLWDYIHRAMPFTQPESLTDDEVYAITAYVLYLNDLVEDDFVLTQDNLASVTLPNAGNFTPDARPDVHNTRCMRNCRSAADIEVISQAPQYVPETTQRVAVAPVTTALGLKVYQRSCALCHDGGIGGAPRVGDGEEWSARLARGRDDLYLHAIEGFQGESGVMPPKGGFVQLADEDVKQAVDHMLEQSQ